jgi:bacterioferritin (cytochrome b1)
MRLSENDLWLLSFYRTSEIAGTLFFGRLARTLRPGQIQVDLTRHFADEAQHARYWTDCIQQLGGEPLGVEAAYQDRYLEAAGLPANLMEVLAITQVFEQRVINQYARHARAPGLEPAIADTLARIMRDETWHLQWVRKALVSMEGEWGKEAVHGAVRRCWEADQKVYEAALTEHADRVQGLLGINREAE